MSDSILTSTKKVLQVPEDYTVFDMDIMMHINSVFATLNQLGIGPEQGYMIEDASSTWDSFIGSDLRLNAVKTYVYLRVRMLFDPPQTGYLVESLKEQQRELEFRLNVLREETGWTDPNLTIDIEDDLYIDGGAP